MNLIFHGSNKGEQLMNTRLKAWLIGLVAWALVIPSMAFALDRDKTAVSPFAQVVPGGSSAGGWYTFMAFTHPSLSTAVSQIELTVSMEGPALTNFVASQETTGDANEVTFTVNAGETHRLFLVGTNHPGGVSELNTNLNDSRTHFILISESQVPTGNIRVLTTNTTPTVADGNGRYNNLNQISMWGVMFYETGSAGFAMEFIGDMHDSTLPGGISTVTLQDGRGIN
jgi:hypothetical protein